MTTTEPASEALLMKGFRLHQQGQIKSAAAIYEDILAAFPQHFNALQLLGLAHRQTGDPENAVRLMRMALAIRKTPAVLSNFGLALADLKRHEEAIESYSEAIALQPEFAEAYDGRGTSFWALKRVDEALSSYERAIEVDPHHAPAHYHRGLVLHSQKHYETALTSYERAIALKPTFAEAFTGLGNTLRELGRLEEAFASYNRAIALRPAYLEALLDRAGVLLTLNRFDEALLECEHLVDLRPDHVEVFIKWGVVLRALRRFGEAQVCFRIARAIQPEHPRANWYESVVQLQAGDFERGWAGYEWRWKIGDDYRLIPRNFHEPLWTGVEDISGKTILLHAEQGIGDAIQFCRYAKHVAARGARVVLQVHTPLTALLNDLDGVDEILTAAAPLPAFDFHCPLLSLPRAFGTRLHSIPADIPYLSPSPEKLSQWRARIGKAHGLRVGLVWSGRASNSNDRNRSISLATILKAMPHGIQIFGLQTEIRPADAAVLHASGQVVDYSNELTDFSDTAALVSLMDLVVSVDTASAHLSGALGKPTWVLLPYVPDWRWLTDRSDSPWYPTMRLFRQPAACDWDSVVIAVKSELQAILDVGTVT